MSHAFSKIEVLIYRPEIFSGLWEATPIIVTDLETGEIVAASPPAHRAFGYDADELIGKTIERLIPLDRRRTHAAHRTSYADAPRLRRMGRAGMSLFGQRKDGSTFPVEIQLSPRRIAEREMVIAVVVDTSDRTVEHPATPAEGD